MNDFCTTFSFDLGNVLLIPLIKQRNMVGVRKTLLKKINYVLNNEGAKPKAALEKLQECYAIRKRCRFCLSQCNSIAEKTT